jgi:YVTN family beta-propeller protein
LRWSALLLAVVQFAAPARDLPAEHLHNAIYDAVLPSGRIVTPLGTSVVTGMNALGFTLSPDGRFAIVSNDDEREAGVRSAVDGRVFGGYSLTVVDTGTMQIADRFAGPGETYFVGVAAVRDPRVAQRSLVFASGGASNAVYVFDLDANGRLTPDAKHVIAIAGPLDPAFGDFGRSFPATLVAAPDGRHIYAVDEGGGDVTTIDTAARTVSGSSRPVGFFPFGAALAGSRLLVSNEGLMRYARVATPPLVPAFAPPPPDALHASSLSLLDLNPRGELGASAALALDAAPDGMKIAGGAHPTAIAVTADARYAFIAMTNVDRIATVGLDSEPQVIGGTELRLFDRGPYGTQPAALALSHDGARLYIALAGLNAIAVLDARDPLHVHRLGLLPAGWFPSALALSADDRTLYVVNTKGFGEDAGFTGDLATGADANAVWSTLQKIDLTSVRLSDTTNTTLKNTRDVRPAAPHYPRGLQNVVVIVEESKTFDSMLGDLGYGPADPSYVRFGAAVTPNLHALARRFGFAGNLFADAEESGGAHQFLTAATATSYSERTLLVKNGRRPLVTAGEDPEDYPRAGSMFNNLERHQISFRDYGDLVRLTGYDDGAAFDPTIDDPAFAGIDDRWAPTHGLGGRYAAAVPAPAVLAGHIDPDYPGWNLRVRDERRAREFIRDYSLLVKDRREPRYTHIWLPADATGSGPGVPPAAEEVADGDRALGTIVEYLSRLPSWKHTAIFVVAGDAQGSRDHVAADRTYALVISPYAKRHFVGMQHLSTVSVLKTAEQILELPPLALGDLLATDMSGFFTPQADFGSFTALGRLDSRPSPKGQPEPEP